MFINIHTALSSQLLGLHTYVVITHRLPGMPAEVLNKTIDGKGVWHFASSATQYHGHSNGCVIPNLTLLTRCLRILVSDQFCRQHSVQLLQRQKAVHRAGYATVTHGAPQVPGAGPPHTASMRAGLPGALAQHGKWAVSSAG